MSHALVERALLAVALCVVTASAHASQQRSFVASYGSDADNCSRASPCRSFGMAITQTLPGGEIVVLDAAGYGPVTIGGSITIIAPLGVYAGISVSSGVGITVNAGASDVVTLRGLTLNGQGGSTGIAFNSGAALFVENCVIAGFTNRAIDLSVSGDNAVVVSDSVLHQNDTGIRVDFNAGGTTTVAVRGSRFERHSSRGIEAVSGRTVVRDSVASGNVTGLSAFFDAELTIDSCVVSHNSSYGVLAQQSSGAGYVVRVSNSTITHNGTGLLRGSTGILASRLNNTIEDNDTDISGGVTSYTAK